MLATRWLLAPSLAEMVVRMERLAGERFAAPGIPWPGIWIISGHRSQETQAELNPSVKASCHTVCPALAVDLRVGSLAGVDSVEVWSILGGMWRLMGGRWGGNFSSDDPSEINIVGINTREMNHFDLGPCG